MDKLFQPYSTIFIMRLTGVFVIMARLPLKKVATRLDKPAGLL
jgi:hypothetical protein